MPAQHQDRRLPGGLRLLLAKRVTDELQALCFLAGVNSIFTGDVLLTTGNPQRDRDAGLLHRLGINSKLGQASS